MKRTGSSHVRVKIVALLAALAALWGFAAYVTVRDGLNLLVANTIGDFGFTTSEMVGALQEERRLSVVTLAGGGSVTADELAASREHTDDLVTAWQDEAESRSVRIAADSRLTDQVAHADAALARLGEVRAGVDSEDLAPAAAAGELTAMVEAGMDIFGAMAGLDDQEIARELRALVSLVAGRELLSQQDALLSGVLAAGEVTDQEIADFTRLVGAQRFVFDSAASELHPDDLALYEEAASGSAITDLRDLEDRFIEEASPGAAPPFSERAWLDTAEPAADALRDVELGATENATDRITPIAVGVIVRLVLAGGLGLVALLAAIIISVTTARDLVRQLERLRDAARDLARNRLPKVVDRLSTGEKVNVATEAPPLRFGDDEIGQVGQAFNAVQETAVRAAVQQAELRRGVRDVFLSLARRTQNLVHKQLTVVDGMERRVTDADEMEELYRIDHLATRMRRNAENLIVLSGSSPGRTWRRPVSMIDVARGAVAEVEDYTRVTLLPVEAAALDGRAVGDVIHLLAELIENAASFSPPYAKVSVAGQRVAHGFVVEVEDRGLGMSEAELAAANEKLAHPPDFSLADASRLGLYVVAKLAQRHGVGVHLRASPYGGVVAIVLIPTVLLVPTGDEAGPPPVEASVDGSTNGSVNGPVGTPTEALDTVPATPASLTSPAIQQGPAGPPAPVSPAAPAGPAGPVGPAAPAGPAQGEPPAGNGADPGGMDQRGMAGHGADQPVVRQRPAPDSQPTATSTPGTYGTPPTPRSGSGAGTGTGPAPAAGSKPLRTPSGLPWRVRQASLPRDLDDGGNGAVDEPVAADPSARDPEQVRRMMRSYQHGTRLGRTEASGTTPEQPGDHQEG